MSYIRGTALHFTEVLQGAGISFELIKIERERSGRQTLIYRTHTLLSAYVCISTGSTTAVTVYEENC